MLRDQVESVLPHPGFSAMWGSTGGYINPPAPFFRCEYASAKKGEPTVYRFRFAETLRQAEEPLCP